jgi:hypothetical protein
MEERLPIPSGEQAVQPDSAVDDFDAKELSPNAQDQDLNPAPPTGDVQPDVDTQHNLDPANEPQPEETQPEPQPAVQQPVEGQPQP